MSKALELAERVAHSLGINVYLSGDGKIMQHPPQSLPGKMTEPSWQEVKALPSSKQSLLHGGEPLPDALPPAG